MTPTATTVVQPVESERHFERIPDPCAVVVFGASGDLMKRKILPALWDLHKDGLLPDRSYIVGFARSELSDEAFRDKMFEGVKTFARNKPLSVQDWKVFGARLSYVQGDYRSLPSYEKLREHLADWDARLRLEGSRLFYLSTPPEVYADAARLLGEAGLSKPGPETWVRLIIEKPFGRDLDSARALNASVREAFSEDQIYRIDHYLGKETVQNLLVFRFANGIFEPMWNREHIDHVQITSAESIGIEGRAGYYERAGALRDMFQNHMLQLVSLVAMEPAARFDANSVRTEKTKVLQSIHPLSPSSVDQFCVRGQYAAGASANGGPAALAYRAEPGVAPESATETYLAARVLIENWRWSGVPFYVRTGKRLKRRATEITIVFKRAPHMMFSTGEALNPNILKLVIQPDEGISLSFGAKVPGQALHIGNVLMDFRYAQSFGVKPIEAYERLIMDCMLGDATLFDRYDSVEAAWTLVAPIIDCFKESSASLTTYPAGSWGPQEADELIALDGHRWRNPGESF